MATIYDSKEVQALGKLWSQRKKEGASQSELDSIHKKAEALRKADGYSGGSDGSSYIVPAGNNRSDEEDFEDDLNDSHRKMGKPSEDSRKDSVLYAVGSDGETVWNSGKGLIGNVVDSATAPVKEDFESLLGWGVLILGGILVLDILIGGKK